MSIPPSSLPARLDPAGEGRAIGDVDGGAGGVDALGLKRRHGLGDLIGIAGADPDIGAFGRQGVGDGPANAARAAENEGVLALEVKIHGQAPEKMSGGHCNRHQGGDKGSDKGDERGGGPSPWLWARSAPRRRAGRPWPPGSPSRDGPERPRRPWRGGGGTAAGGR